MENMGNLSLTVTDLIQAKPDEEAVISILTKVEILMMMIYILLECISEGRPVPSDDYDDDDCHDE